MSVVKVTLGVAVALAWSAPARAELPCSAYKGKVIDVACTPDPPSGTPSGDGSGTTDSGDGDGAPYEETDADIQAKIDAQNERGQAVWDASGPHYAVGPDAKPGLAYDASDPYSNDGPLPSGTLRVTSFAGQPAPWPELAAIAHDFQTRNAFVSEWSSQNTVFGTTLEEDLAWLETLPFLGRNHRAGGGDVTEDEEILRAGEQLGDRMPNDLARDNLGKIASFMSTGPNLVNLALRGDVGVSHVAFNEVRLVVPAKVQDDIRTWEQVSDQVTAATSYLANPPPPPGGSVAAE